MSPISNCPSTLWSAKGNNQKVIKKYSSCTLWFQSRITESCDYKIPNQRMLSTFRMSWDHVSKFYPSGSKKMLPESDHKVLSLGQSEHFLKETKTYWVSLNVIFPAQYIVETFKKYWVMWPQCPWSMIAQYFLIVPKKMIRKWSKGTWAANCGFDQNILSYVTTKYQIGKV